MRKNKKVIKYSEEESEVLALKAFSDQEIDYKKAWENFRFNIVKSTQHFIKTKNYDDEYIEILCNIVKMLDNTEKIYAK